MPEFNYSVIGLDPDKTAKASGRDMRVSPKDSREICNALKGKMLSEAKLYLEAVVEKKQIVPYRRYRKEVPHHANVYKWCSGRFPVNASQAILTVLNNIEANAEFKGLDIDRLRIVHIMAQRGRKLRRYYPRAFNRATKNFKPLTHIEVVVEEQ